MKVSDDGDVHVMPDDEKHTASSECHCAPKEDEQTKQARAQGQPTTRVWVHNQLN